MYKKGFTLSEVLITLGVIGVVVAMTLPSVINKFRAKALETSFKKSYSNINKAFLNTKIELASDSVYKDFGRYNNVTGYSDFYEFQNVFYKNLVAVKIYDGEYQKRTYNGGQLLCETYGYCPNPIYILSDGSSVETNVNSQYIWLNVDTNGPLKGPNRYGFDIFAFYINNNNDCIILPKMEKLYTQEELNEMTNPGLKGMPCSKKSNQGANGVGCAWYAFNNVNPDDETETYWDNLPR